MFVSMSLDTTRIIKQNCIDMDQKQANISEIAAKQFKLGVCQTLCALKKFEGPLQLCSDKYYCKINFQKVSDGTFKVRTKSIV